MSISLYSSDIMSCLNRQQFLTNTCYVRLEWRPNNDINIAIPTGGGRERSFIVYHGSFRCVIWKYVHSGKSVFGMSKDQLSRQKTQKHRLMQGNISLSG